MRNSSFWRQRNDARKKFVKFRLQAQKKNIMVSVLLTAVDQANYYVCCVTRQYLFRIHFFGSQSLSECPTYLYNYIYLLQSSFFFSNTSCSKISVTLNRDYLRPSITWQKERACNVLISEFLAPSRAIYIYSKQFSVKKKKKKTGILSSYTENPLYCSEWCFVI